MNLLERFFSCKFIKYDFSLKDIKDSSGELQRLKLTREHLFTFKEMIVESDAYNQILAELHASENDNQKYLRSYFEKSVIHSEIMKSGCWRTIFLISVIEDFMLQNAISKVLYVMPEKPWINQYKKYGSKYGISIDCEKGLFSLRDKSLMRIIRSFPKFHFLLKILKYRSGFLTKVEDQKSTLFLEGRGDIIFEKNGKHSDFLWQIESNFPSDRINYQYENDHERHILQTNRIDAVKITPYVNDFLSLPKKAINLRKDSRCQLEFEELKRLYDYYHSNFLTLKSFFDRKNIKIFLTWDRYDADHIIKTDAINSLGGVSAIMQIAFDGVPLIDNRIHSDIVFSYSRLSFNHDKKLGSKFKYHVITGCTKDYLNPQLEKQAQFLKEKLLINGAKNIVCVFDENSVDDNRWHTGHTLQRDNYKYILEEIMSNQSLGVIFKPKSSKTLRKRLGKINTILKKAEKTGRCIVLDDINRHTTSASPIIAALSSDICIHGHLCAGSAGLESSLCGKPTILIDREGLPDSKLNQLPHGKTVFKDWPSAIKAINTFFSDGDKLSSIGDWSNIIDDLDPYRDGLGAKRMGSFLNDLRMNFDQGMNKDQAMEMAAMKYENRWGPDKIIKNH
ncbi:MAG: hypothetical protein P8L74_00190 [Gammaproteobacteria bacterium]|nr:hypothetical protein [Gammaproteobacteria bacterium]